MTPKFGEHLRCPVDGCDWSLDIDSLDMQHAVIARVRRDWFTVDGLLTRPGAIETFVGETVQARAKVIDEMLRAHLGTHDVLDWLKTVRRLEMDLAQSGRCLRPHVVPPELVP